jgi:hypothetical protein
MQVRVTWPCGKKRRIYIKSLRDLDRFVGWQVEQGRSVDLTTEGDGFRLAVKE